MLLDALSEVTKIYPPVREKQGVVEMAEKLLKKLIMEVDEKGLKEQCDHFLCK